MASTSGRSEPGCPFCALDDPAVTVYADALVQALVSLRPINQCHVIVVPRVHVEHFSDIAPETMEAVMAAAQSVARAMISAAAPDGITYITEDDLTGQGYNLVAHWKLHIIARFKADAVKLDWARQPDPGPIARARLASDIRHYLSAT